MKKVKYMPHGPRPTYHNMREQNNTIETQESIANRKPPETQTTGLTCVLYFGFSNNELCMK